MGIDMAEESKLVQANNIQNRKSMEGIENVLHTLSNILSTSVTKDSSGQVASTSKTSSEILSELFSSLNAEPPNLSESFQDNNVSTSDRCVTDCQDISDDDSLKKTKSHKRKHKHKSKKHKKKIKREKTSCKSSMKGSGNSTDVESSQSLNKLFPFAPDVKTKKRPVDENNFLDQIQPVNCNETHVTSHLEKCSEDSCTGTKQSTNCSEAVPDNEIAKNGVGACKISIKDLKFSSVYEATLKEVEQQAKERAERFEEGEISNSSREATPKYESEGENDANMVDASVVSNDRVKRKHKSCSRHSEHKSRLDHHSPKRKKSHIEIRSSDEHCHRKSKSRKSKDRSDYEDGHSRHRRRKESKQDREGRDDDSHRRKCHSKSSKSTYRSRSSESRERDQHHKRSRSYSRDRSSERDKTRSDRRKTSSHRRDNHSRKRSRSHSKSPSFDKQKLMEIARKNALNLLKHGALPGSLGQDKMVSIKSGGKSVEELTNFCKRLSKKEAGRSDSEEEDDANSDSETERPFNHPFQIKEKPQGIVMNIRNSTQLPIKSLQEKTAEQSKILRVQFPVSSGQQHRKTESEWVPVEPKPPTSKEQQLPSVNNETTILPPTDGQVFPTQTSGPVKDIGNIVTQRLRAMRKLQENPHDIQALTAMYSANQDMQNWAESKQLPGQFTGSTGVKVLSVAELSSGTQAYVKKNQLVSAAPVSGGMGMSLLQKMGWRPGEGLGKNKGGSLEPLSLEIKMDKRGLVSQEDLKQLPNQQAKRPTVVKTLTDKHPISVLIEYCARKRWKTPVFEMCHESGPDHKKNFLFKVQVNGVDYQPVVTSSTKKLAKADAATVCLRALGVFSG